MRSNTRLALALGALVLAAPVPALAQAQAQEYPQITVTGEGVVAAVPDMAVITLGVTERDASARVAMDATSQGVAAILERLRGFGIADTDLQTSELSLNPLWQDRAASGAPTIEGYEASNRLTVRLRDVGRLGEVLEAVLEDGANRLDGLSFGMQEPRPLLDEARRRAVADAQARAELFAEAAGVPLGPLFSLTETMGYAPRPDMMMAARAESVPVAAGETTLSAQVTMVFDIGEAE